LDIFITAYTSKCSFGTKSAGFGTRKSFEKVSKMDRKGTGHKADSFVATSRSCRRRRFSSFINFHHMGIGGRRIRARRKEEKINCYVDQYHDPMLFFVVLSIIIMSVLDAFFTILLLENGNVIEVNPLMAALIEKGNLYFFNVKYLLTALSLILLVIHKNFSIFGAFKTTQVIFFIFGGFFLLNIYQIYLLI
jgi:hypothetical protein